MVKQLIRRFTRNVFLKNNNKLIEIPMMDLNLRRILELRIMYFKFRLCQQRNKGMDGLEMGIRILKKWGMMIYLYKK